MPKRELEAVLAHEVSHIRNRDTYLMTMATVFAGVIALIADIGFRSLAYGGARRGKAARSSRSSRSSASSSRRMRRCSADEPLAPPRVPRGRRRGGDPERPRGDGARAPPARARHRRRSLRRRVDGPSVGREPDRSRRLATRGSASSSRARSTRIRRCARESRRSRRPAVFGLPERLSPDAPFAASSASP